MNDVSSFRRRGQPRLLAAGVLAAACAAASWPAHATPKQSLDAVRAAAERHVRERIPAGPGTVFATAGALDPRLLLAPCAGPLQAALPPGATLRERTTVGVSCREGATWTVYVPVSIESEIPVLVLRRAAARGAALTPDDVEVQRRRLPGFASQYLSDPEAVRGQTLRRPLGAGAALTVDALVPDVLVRRGQRVTLLAAAGGVEVRAGGRALSDGRAGSRVRVQNLSSLEVVEGVVEGRDVIRVTP